MHPISIKNLDQIHAIKLTPEFAKRGQEMPDDLAIDIMETALHEAAHLVAAIASKSFVGYVHLRYSKLHGAAGATEASGRLPEHDAFISLAGPAWDSQHYGPYENSWQKRCKPDLVRGARESSEAGVDPDTMFLATGDWVSRNKEVISYAAIGLLALSPKSQGPVNQGKLRALIMWLHPQVTPYRRNLG